VPQSCCETVFRPGYLHLELLLLQLSVYQPLNNDQALQLSLQVYSQVVTYRKFHIRRVS